MALPPSDSDSFQREVDENYRRDRMADFGKTYGKWIALAVVAFLVIVAAVIWWRSEQTAKAGEQSEELAKVMADYAAGTTDGLDTRLQAVASEGKGATRASALLTEAALAMAGNDRARAAAIYAEMAADDSLPKPHRDLALVREVMLTFDNAEPSDVVAKLQPLAQPGEPFFGTAGELTAAALLKMGRDDEAAQLFGRIAAEPTIPESLKVRAAQMASSLGVQPETAALPTPEDTE